MDRAARFAAAGTCAAALLVALSPNFAAAQKVPAHDGRLSVGLVEFDSPAGDDGRVRAYLARRAQASGPLPVVLVLHENRGLIPHIQAVARRLALENFIALSADALFPLGDYSELTHVFADDDERISNAWPAATLAWCRTLALFNRRLRG